MFEIAVMNPRRARGKKRAKRRRSNPAMKRNSKGRFVKRASNPRKKHRKHRASNPRKHRRKHRASNPRRRKRRANPHHRKHRRHVARKGNPRRRRRRNPRHRHHRRHRNPRFLAGLQGGIVGTLKDGAVAGAGALINSVILGFGLPLLPTTFTTGYALDAVRIATATGLAIAGKKFGGRMGEEAGKGAVAVAMYLLFRDILVSMAPTLPLGDYEEISIDSTADLGAYMNGTGAYMSGFLPDGSRARQGAGAYMSGLGAYMDPAARLSGYSGPYGGGAYEGESDGFTLNGQAIDGLDY
jgi:hypothetical protein